MKMETLRMLSMDSGQRTAHKIAAFFFALEEIVVNCSLVFFNL